MSAGELGIGPVAFDLPAVVIGDPRLVTATVGQPAVWSIEGDALGCTIDPETGRIKPDKQPGQIRVRATVGGHYAVADLFVLRIAIDRVVRGAGLPPSVRLGGVAEVAVTVTPNLPPESGLGITFRVDGSSDNHGAAEVLPHEPVTACGTIRVRGLAQTRPGKQYLRRLNVSPLIGGAPVGPAPDVLTGFSVCAHPIGVENGFEAVVNDPVGDRYGLQVRIRALSDSGQTADLDEVQTREVVSPTHSHSSSMQGMPPQISAQGREHDASQPITDIHGLKKVNFENALHYLQEGTGQWSNDQVDVFFCSRCGLERPKPVPNSGYRVTRRITRLAGERVRLFVRKEAQGCEVTGNENLYGFGAVFTSAAGPSAPIERDCGEVQL